MRASLQNILLALAATTIALLGVEVLARATGAADQFSRMISSKDAPHHIVDGVVLWGVRNPRYTDADIRRVGFAEQAFVVLGLGDSVLFGADLAKDDTYFEVARRILAQRSSRPVELLNMAIPGYSTMQEDATYRQVEDRIIPDLVLVHYWGDDASQFRVVGGHIVNFGDLGADGRTIIRPFPFPPGVSDFLLLHSRLYDVMVGIALRDTSRSPTLDWERVATPMAAIHERARRVGARMVIIASAQLNGAHATAVDGLESLRGFGVARGIEVIDLSQWLQGVDVRRVALDGCHFNAEGHQLIGKRFAEYLLERDLKVQD